jgi:hypothetical protein
VSVNLQFVEHEKRNQLRREIEFRPRIRLTSFEPTRFDEWHAAIRPIISLVQISTGEQCWIDEFVVSVERALPGELRDEAQDTKREPIEMLGQRSQRSQRGRRGRNHRGPLLPRGSLSDDVLQRWMDLHRSLEPAIFYLFGELNADSSVLENRLVSLTSYVEAYHGRLHAAKGTLRERLVWVVERARPVTPRLEPFATQLSDEIVDSRTRIIHDKHGPASLDGMDLGHALSRLVAVLLANLLLDLGLAPEAIRESMKDAYATTRRSIPEAVRPLSEPGLVHALFPEDAYQAAAQPIGRACGLLLLIESQWVHRRVERLDVLSAQLVRRSVSVDFTVPSMVEESLGLEPSGPALVPLATLTKRPLRNFDLRDEDGRALPVVGKDHNGPIAHAALVAQAETALSRAGRPPPSKELRDLLQVVAREPVGPALDAVGELLTRSRRTNEEASVVLGDEAAQVLIRDLAENYVLFAVVDDVSSRRLLKYSYEEPVAIRPAGVAARLGWSPVFVSIDVPAAAGPASYHAEVVVPEELRIRDALLIDQRDGRLFAADEESDRAALHAPQVPYEGQPLLIFLISLERAGLPSLGAAAAVLTAVQIATGALLFDVEAAPPAPAVTVLLGGTAFFVAALARSGEHRLVKALFAWPRLLLVLVALCAATSAAFLAYGAKPEAVRLAWGIAAGIASAAAGMLVITARRARPLVVRNRGA